MQWKKHENADSSGVGAYQKLGQASSLPMPDIGLYDIG